MVATKIGVFRRVSRDRPTLHEREMGKGQKATTGAALDPRAWIRRIVAS